MSIEENWAWFEKQLPHAARTNSATDGVKRWALWELLDRVFKNKEKETLRCLSIDGEVGGKFEDFKKLMESTGGRLVFLQVRVDAEDAKMSPSSFVFSWDEAFAVGSASNEELESSWVEFEFCTFDPKIEEKIGKKICAILKKRTLKKDVFIIKKEEGGLALSPIKSKPEPLVRENYVQSVLEDFDHIVEDLQKENPCGRIAIVEGPPGSGKTHLIRGLLSTVEGCVFVLFPSKMMSDVSSPGMLSSLIDFRRAIKGPIVLIIEDGDALISSRKMDSSETINELLNLGDGILGSALDIRIIITTNVKNDDIDKAILRQGRLCRHVYIGELDIETEKKIIIRMRLKIEPSGHRVLSELYGASRPDAVPEKPKRKMGFST